jgi:16S rRNA (cytidine1402-2'-O)-methyltransferase
MERPSTEKAHVRPSTLYVVATPIGNLQDITIRAIEVLKSVDVVAAEDTRVSGRLLAHYNINAPKLISVHEHNETRVMPQVVGMLARGSSVALVTDAGTPAISDPGSRLVAGVRSAGYQIVPVPGPNAAAAAMSAGGFDRGEFVFYGFLPAKAGDRRKALQTLEYLPYTLVFYEAPHRVLETLADMTQVFSAERRLVIARELTKMFETIHACSLGEAGAWLSADDNRLKGEFVLLVAGAEPDADRELAEASRVLDVLLAELPVKQASALAAKISGARKNDLYALALSRKPRED